MPREIPASRITSRSDADGELVETEIGELSVCLSRTGVFTPPRSPYGAFSRLTSALNLQLLFDAKGLNVARAGYINSAQTTEDVWCHLEVSL